jgi:hypothetical protein
MSLQVEARLAMLWFGLTFGLGPEGGSSFDSNPSRYCAISRSHAAIKAAKVGDPFAVKTNLGPLVNKTQFEKVQRMIQRGIDEGATLVAGGLGRPDGFSRGYFVKPTVFSDVRNDMTIARDEIFGPVLSIIGTGTKTMPSESPIARFTVLRAS